MSGYKNTDIHVSSLIVLAHYLINLLLLHSHVLQYKMTVKSRQVKSLCAPHQGIQIVTAASDGW